MDGTPEDPERDDRILMEIVVDAYDAVERALGWYCYLQNNLQFPFTAVCTQGRSISPLKPDQKVKVIGQPPEEECEHEMFVTIRWKGEELSVPLSQLQPLNADDETRQAVEDWHYWVHRGYRFS